MASIGEADYDELEALWAQIENGADEPASLEAFADYLIGGLYARYADSLVLARMFVTIDLRALPPAERAFAERFAQDFGMSGQLDDGTVVLTLLASRGQEPQWNDRRRSHGHLAIPLPSEGFVGEIPMIATLLKQIGFAGWHASGTGLVTKSLANLNGVFFVPDARSAVDERERPVIPAADFVERHGVRTVFGVGGSYLSRHAFVSTILFCNEMLLRGQAMKFVPLVASFKAATTRLVNRGAFFEQRG